jgi:membrane-associated phospholipid phosphatase
MLKKLLVIISIFVTSATHASDLDIERIGDLLMVITPAYAFGMTSRESNFDGAIQYLTDFAATQLVTEGIKAFELEERPNGSNRRSFPSGHSAAAFSGAMFIHKRYGWRPAILPYAMAGVTGWTRVHAKMHYWHDVLAGAAVAALCTWTLVDKYDSGSYVAISADTTGAKVNFSTKF